MKNIFLIFLLSGLVAATTSCHETIDLPVESCTLPFADSSSNHPKQAVFQAILEDYVKKGLPGIVMAVHSPEDGLWIGAAGKSKLETGEDMLPCHLFHSASVSKMYMVATAMSLVEEGLMDLNATIDNYLPAAVSERLPNGKTTKLRHLMNHRSGIPDFIEEVDHIMDYYNNLMKVFTTEDYLEYIYDKKPRFEPGTGGSYSNTNTVVLALAMEHVTGRDHASLVTERVFKKLGVMDTYYKSEPGYPAPDGLVNTYLDYRGTGQLQNISEVERNFAQMNIAHDAMIASAYDYFRFISGLFNGEIISENSVDTMIANGNRLGVFRFPSELYGVTKIGHDGGSLGAANQVYYYPEEKTSIVICSNFGGFLDSPLGDLFYGFRVGREGTIIGEVEQVLFE